MKTTEQLEWELRKAQEDWEAGKGTRELNPLDAPELADSFFDDAQSQLELRIKIETLKWVME
jgi:hypothetical protein